MLSNNANVSIILIAIRSMKTKPTIEGKYPVLMRTITNKNKHMFNVITTFSINENFLFLFHFITNTHKYVFLHNQNKSLTPHQLQVK